MNLEYVSDRSVSTQRVSAPKWRFGLAMGLLLSLAGGMLAALLALGLADPPYAGRRIMMFEQPSPNTVIPWDMEISRLGALPSPPLTIELRAASPSAWGIWLGREEGNAADQYGFLVGGDGYISAGTLDNTEWSQFIHARPGANVLYLHIDANRLGTFRINEEIVWTGRIDILPNMESGVISTPKANTVLDYIYLYTD